MVGSNRAGFCSLSGRAWDTAFSCSLPALPIDGISLSHTLVLISLSGTVSIAGRCKNAQQSVALSAAPHCSTTDSLINHSIAD